MAARVGWAIVAFPCPPSGRAARQVRTIYLSWAEAGDGDTRGAVVGKGTPCVRRGGCLRHRKGSP